MIDVLVHILHAPSALIHQQSLLAEEVDMILKHAPQTRPTQGQIDADPSMKDGIPKDKNGCDCPICYRPILQRPSVCCKTCGRHTHSLCFATWASYSPWAINCLVCKSPWTQPISEKSAKPGPAKRKRAA